MVAVSFARDYGDPGVGNLDDRYTCAWGPDTAGWPRPSMLRITYALDDTGPSARIGAGQTFEYVVKLQ